jgi:hypothetical protein
MYYYYYTTEAPFLKRSEQAAAKTILRPERNIFAAVLSVKRHGPPQKSRGNSEADDQGSSEDEFPIMGVPDDVMKVEGSQARSILWPLKGIECKK